MDGVGPRARLLAMPSETRSGRVRVSVILPTYDESRNLPELVPKLVELLREIRHEVIVVDDDSPDGTWQVAEELGDRFEDVRLVRRVGRRGLASAVIEGFLAAEARSWSPRMPTASTTSSSCKSCSPRWKAARAWRSRHGTCLAAACGEWDERRHALSRLATRLAQRLCRCRSPIP